jgi:hypothetical protein
VQQATEKIGGKGTSVGRRGKEGAHELQCELRKLKVQPIEVGSGWKQVLHGEPNTAAMRKLRELVGEPM